MTLPSYMTTITPLSKLLALSMLVLFPVLGFFLGIHYDKQMRGPAQTSSVLQTDVPQDYTPTPPTQSMDDREREYFISEILPKYPNLSTEFTGEQIDKIYPMTLNYVSDGGTGYLVRVKNPEGSDFFYLVTPRLQKKLDHPMTDTGGEDSNCTIQKVLPIGNSPARAGFDDQKNKSYILISGNECVSFGSGSFTSLYSLETGEKIKMSGKTAGIRGFPLANLAGNAPGDLLGVYGAKNPTIVVEYGYIDGAEKAYVFFDLASGKAKQAVRLN